MKNHSSFYYKSQPVASGQTEPLTIPGTMFCVLSSTGTVEMSFDGDDWIPLPPIGWVFKQSPGDLFAKIWFRSAGGGSVQFYYGFGDIAAQSSGGGGGSSNLDGHGSPMGVVTPTAADQFYTDVDAPALWQSTGITNNSWRQWI